MGLILGILHLRKCSLKVRLLLIDRSRLAIRQILCLILEVLHILAMLSCLLHHIVQLLLGHTYDR